MNPCACGCGEMANKTFVRGHVLNLLNASGRNGRTAAGKDSPHWRGGRSTNGVGYVTIRDAEHPNANSAKQVLEHVAIAASALGRPIPKGVEVHHVNENPADNSHDNLVVCEDHAYHMLLHRRRDALLACGNPNFMKCEICHQYDDPRSMTVSRARAHRATHRACRAKASRDWRARHRATKHTAPHLENVP